MCTEALERGDGGEATPEACPEAHPAATGGTNARVVPMSLREAILPDRRGDLASAANQYEQELTKGRPTLHVLLDLAVLYWQTTDVGLAAAQGLTPELLATASTRFPTLLAEARRRFPERTAPRFWQKYITWADLSEPFGAEECMGLLREVPSDLEPAMHAFAISQGTPAQAEAAMLLRACREAETTRSRYVASVIEGVMRRGGLR